MLHVSQLIVYNLFVGIQPTLSLKIFLKCRECDRNTISKTPRNTERLRDMAPVTGAQQQTPLSEGGEMKQQDAKITLYW